MSNQNYRYPGTQSFQKTDSHIFFGRDDDCSALLRLIRLEQLVVLYGKSGLGKTSLLNAGILPKLVETTFEEEGERGTTEHYQTMELRLFAWQKDSQSPLDTLYQQTVGNQPIHPLLEKAGLASKSL